MLGFGTVLSALENAHARYVVVGGLAVILHGHLRGTADIDLVIELSPENCRRALDALAGAGLKPRLPVDMLQFADPEIRRDWVEKRNMLVFQLWDPDVPGRSVDVFVREPFGFEELWAKSVLREVQGVPARIASIEHLVAMKRSAGRHRDLDDIAALEQIERGNRE